MICRRFETCDDESTGHNLTLQDLLLLQQWTDEEANQIADLKTGKSLDFENIRITRVK